jgi:hypothetical protein
MKKHSLILIVVAAAFLGVAPAYAQSTPTPTPAKGTQCKRASSHTELYGFCGTKEGIIKKIASLPVQLSDRRVFVQLTQGDSGGEVKLFERQDNGTFKVTTWSTPETSMLLAEIDKTMFDNKGVNCVGEEVKNVLEANLKNPTVTEVAGFNTPAAAFTDSVEKAGGKSVRTLMEILC